MRAVLSVVERSSLAHYDSDAVPLSAIILLSRSSAKEAKPLKRTDSLRDSQYCKGTVHGRVETYGALLLSTYSIIGKNSLVPQTEILAILFIQILELNGAFLLLKYTAKPKYKLSSFFKNNASVETRNWVLASAVGFGVLVLLLFLTSLIASRLFGSKPVNNSILKEILLSSDVSRVACDIVYCIVCPLLEEVVWRGFLLTSLSSTIEWPQAVAVSSAIFSACHFSGESFVQLFIIGCVLGCSYCWTGNLKSPLLIHSLYNALTLIISYLY
ncbi:hypothetical protein K1719_031212 [Acacia pycnantha]|nr:hypothetical protein K1719_031212 [Acacia pycnantha]